MSNIGFYALFSSIDTGQTLVEIASLTAFVRNDGFIYFYLFVFEFKCGFEWFEYLLGREAIQFIGLIQERIF